MDATSRARAPILMNPSSGMSRFTYISSVDSSYNSHNSKLKREIIIRICIDNIRKATNVSDMSRTIDTSDHKNTDDVLLC